MTRVSWARRPTRIGAGLAVELVESAGAYGGSPRGANGSSGMARSITIAVKSDRARRDSRNRKRGRTPDFWICHSRQKGSSTSPGSPIGSQGSGSRSLPRSSVSDSHCGARSGRAVATRGERFGEAVEDRVDERFGERRIGALQDFAEVAEVAVEPVDVPLRFAGSRFAVGSAAQADDQLGQATADAEHADSQRHVGGVIDVRSCATRWPGNRPRGGADPSRPVARVRTTRRRSDGYVPPSYAALPPIPRECGGGCRTRIRRPCRCRRDARTTGPGISPIIWQQGQSGSTIASWPRYAFGQPGAFAVDDRTRRSSMEFGIGRIEPRVADAFQARDFGREEVADRERLRSMSDFAGDRARSVSWSQQDQSSSRTSS